MRSSAWSTSTGPERQPLGQAPSHTGAARPVPNVNRSGKLHHPTPTSTSRRLPHGPERQPLGQAPSPFLIPVTLPGADGSRTSTARASSITSMLAARRVVGVQVPNVNRSGKLHHPNTPTGLASAFDTVPNVNRSGKLHHPASRGTRVQFGLRPERQPLGQAPSPCGCKLPARRFAVSRTSTARASSITPCDARLPLAGRRVPNVNRSGKLHHPASSIWIDFACI